MSTTTGPPSQAQHAQNSTPSTGSAAPARSSTSEGSGAELESSQGRTTVADAVVSKIAALAAKEVPGISGFGGGSRAFGAVRGRISGARTASTQGVTVEVGERQAAVDLVVVVEYGAPVVELARAVRRNVIRAVEQMTGLDVVEVNINVTDLHLPGSDDDSDDAQPAKPARVS